MITARNYAAQAELATINAGFPSTANLIKSAVHFALPDGGTILNDGAKGLIGAEQLRLPYPLITVEWYNGTTKFVVVAVDKKPQKDFCITAMVLFCTKDKWDLLPYAFGIWEVISPSEWSVSVRTLKDNIDVPQHDLDADTKAGIGYCVRSLLELLEALSCRNVVEAKLNEASPKNARRIKDGKLPIYETKMLVVDTKASFNSNGEYQGGSHSSPRQHLRRGHIRRHPTAGNIWVQSCVVGNASNGSIHKQYQVI